VLEENGVRVATADRLDMRDHLVQTFVRSLVLPFALALVGVLLLTWWICTLSLQPLQRLRDELVERPPQDPRPVKSGHDIKELAPLVDSLNQLLERMDASIEHERRWTTDAAHELRTPLTAIKTHVQVAQMALAANTPNAAQDRVANALRQAGEGIDHMHATLESCCSWRAWKPLPATPRHTGVLRLRKPFDWPAGNPCTAPKTKAAQCPP
jgi:signal transduction histidine kinase